jgi:hypothetical protein
MVLPFFPVIARLSPMCKVKIVEVVRFPVESKPVSYSWFPFK